MFNKNNARPAYAHANLGRSGTSHSFDNFTFSSADDTNEYNAFNSQNRSQRRPSNNANKAPKRKPDKTIYISPSLIAGVIAAMAILVLIVIIIVAAASGGKDIKYENNAFVLYTDVDGNYYISVNGNTIDAASFEGKVSLRESADRSFAYVEESFGNELNIYVLNTKELIPVNISPVDDILAYSEYEPGIVYKDNGTTYLYTEEHLEEIITNDTSAYNFSISGDGTTVVYSTINAEKKVSLNIFKSGENSEKIASGQIFANKVSFDGSYVYCYALVADDNENQTYRLYMIDATDGYEKIAIGDGTTPKGSGIIPVGVNAMNAQGNEIIYFTTVNNEIVSHIYSVKKNESYTIAKGYFTSAIIDPEIVCLETFKDSYVQNASSDQTGSTYYVNNKYEPEKLAEYVGTFSPNEDYFYYINGEATLIQLDLNDDNHKPERVLTDVKEFAVTQKGNVYILTTDHILRFYEVADNKKSKITEEADQIVMQDYSNILYFSEIDSVAVYSTKEGSAKESVEFDKSDISALPEFKYTNMSKTYAYYYDADNVGLKLYYSSNGKKFKLVTSECAQVIYD